VSVAAPSVGGGAPTRNSRPADAVFRAKPPAAQLMRRVLQASHDVDPVGLQAQLDLAASVLGLARCVDEVVTPAMRRLHRLMEIGRRDAAEELLATEAVRTWLNHRGMFAPPPWEIAPILLACGPRDRQVIGIESLALLLRFQRRPCRVLGDRVSTFTLTMAAQAADAAGVVVMAGDTRGWAHATAALRAVDALGLPVFFAGNAFHLTGTRRQLPGTFLGTSVEGACTLLVNTLTPAVQRRSTAADRAEHRPRRGRMGGRR
jgi:MerR family transcriptional regulator, light-induced transcriptional regulator